MKKNSQNPLSQLGIFRIIPIIAGLITIIGLIITTWDRIAQLVSFDGGLIYYINLIICIGFIIMWFYNENHKEGIKHFNIPWIAFWAVLGLFYGLLIFKKNTLTLELFLNNASNIFIFFLYLLLNFPKGVDYSGKEIYVNSFASAVIVMLGIMLFTLLFPNDYGRIFSGFFAFTAYSFLGSRLESYFPKNYILLTLIFFYAAVQILWIFVDENHEVLKKETIYFLAFIGKLFFGAVITFKYKTITNKSLNYYKIKAKFEREEQKIVD